MATIQSVKSKIQGLIDSANAKIGGAKTDLTSAVNALIEGYGKVSLQTDSWETISQRSADGSAKLLYKVGDSKEITLTDGTTVTMTIAGFDLHRNEEGTKEGITFIQTSGHISATYTSAISSMAAKLPDEVNSVIKNTKITTMGWDNTSKVYIEKTTEDVKLFVPEAHNFNADLSEYMSCPHFNFDKYSENTYDNTVFPLFDGISHSEFVSTLGIPVGNSIHSRSVGRAANGSSSLVQNVIIAVNESSLLPVSGFYSAGDVYNAICFRV